MDITNIAFCRKTSQDGHYRYFTVNNHPILAVALDYVYNDDLESDNHDCDEEEAPPTKSGHPHNNHLIYLAHYKVSERNESLTRDSAL